MTSVRILIRGRCHAFHAMRGQSAVHVMAGAALAAGTGTKQYTCVKLVLSGLQGREKIALIKQFTAMGSNILVSDIDTVWLRDPLPYMAQYPQADILMSSDSLVSSGQNTAFTRWSAGVDNTMQPAGHAAFAVGCWQALTSSLK